LSSADEFFDLWKLGASRFHLQLASLEIDTSIEGCLFEALTFRDPGTLTHHLFFVIRSLY